MVSYSLRSPIQTKQGARNDFAPLMVQLPEVVAALAVLPLLAITGTLVFRRPVPSWSAFRGPGS